MPHGPVHGPLRLHRHLFSGHCHRVETFLAMLELPYQLVDVALEKREQKAPSFMLLNPLGQVPVLEDGDIVISDSNAILVYLASRYDTPRSWLPEDPVRAAEVQRWFSLAAGPLAQGPGAARRANVFGGTVDREVAERIAAALFGAMEAHLSGHLFLVGEQPTLADLSMYAYTARAPEGGIALSDFPALRAWLARVEALPRFVPMPHAPARAR